MHGHASDGLFWLYLSTVVRNNVTPVGFMHSKASCDFGNVVHVTCTLSQFFFFFFRDCTLRTFTIPHSSLVGLDFTGMAQLKN